MTAEEQDSDPGSHALLSSEIDEATFREEADGYCAMLQIILD